MWSRVGHIIPRLPGSVRVSRRLSPTSTTTTTMEARTSLTMDTAGVERSNITGVVLHVEENDEQPSETLTFHKTRSRTIAVGRKSSQGVAESDPARALFRCPVVSRKHAKITFTECGNVYIIDLHSHHGTHILRPGELVSTPLKPEIPTVLADGDLITFGKSVGRDIYLVRPIVLRVELIFGGDALSPALLPLPRSLDADTADDAQPSSLSQSKDDEHEHDKGSARPGTGRYGVFLPSPESSSSSSDGDSDIQEISPPSSPHSSAPLLPYFSRSHAALSLARLRLLQRILPPIRPLSASIGPFSLEEGEDQEGANQEEDMDLSSSRASSPFVQEPSIIGAWPDRLIASPFALPYLNLPSMNEQRDIIEISDDDSGSSAPDVSRADTPAQQSEPMREIPVPVFETAMLDLFGAQVEQFAKAQTPRPEYDADHNETVELSNGSADVEELGMGMLEAQVADTYTELNVLRAAQDKNESEFNAYAERAKARLDALDNQMHSTQTSLTERAGELSAITTRLKDLGNIVSALQEHSALAERVDELVKEVGAAKDLLQETCELQRQTRTQMVEELAAVKTLREEAAAAVAEGKQACAVAQAQATEPNTLKRKRDDADDGEDGRAVGLPQEPAASPSPSKRRRTLRVISAIAHSATMATVGAVAAWGALAYS
ncbi:hypothetical protein C8Q74DRAFT_1232557 [Fomes fomentarius]|nr:hypothetical protein C8Q74DRAFT_1232557 [Fomes fomentarius]